MRKPIRKADGSLHGFHTHLSVACMLLSVGIVREPPLGHTVALLENLFYSPERGESQYPEERLGENRLHEQRTHESRKSEHQKPPPASCTEIIIAFDYYGVEKSDDKKSRDTEKKSSKIHKIIAIVIRKDRRERLKSEESEGSEISETSAKLLLLDF